jgi:hypothetical protein
MGARTARRQALRRARELFHSPAKLVAGSLPVVEVADHLLLYDGGQFTMLVRCRACRADHPSRFTHERRSLNGVPVDVPVLDVCQVCRFEGVPGLRLEQAVDDLG